MAQTKPKKSWWSKLRGLFFRNKSLATKPDFIRAAQRQRDKEAKKAAKKDVLHQGN